MKQVLQNLKDGRTELWDVPAPGVSRGSLLIETATTLLSSGTERMLVDFGRASLLGKARQQPDRVRDALLKVRTDGLAATLSAINDKLDQPLPLGYCNAGVVTATGLGVNDLKVGDRVVSNGKHAEYVTVGENLCVRIPDNVSNEDAAFAIPAAIGLQGVRLAAPTLGETFVVFGLGLIGLLTVQILIANGCRVIGIDRDPARAKLAEGFGARIVPAGTTADVVADVLARTGGVGADGVLICASTSSDEPLTQSAKMSRTRGRIVLVGITGLNLARADFYEKELSFQVSCSYGPGRYDPRYEEKGFDYPIGHVRWTENRNIAAALELMADERLTPKPLITHRFALSEAESAYELLVEKTPSLGILIEYPAKAAAAAAAAEAGHPALKLVPMNEPARFVPLAAIGTMAAMPVSVTRVNIIGAGNYAGRVLIPAFRRAGAMIDGIASRNGVTAAHYGRKHGAAFASTDAAGLCASPDAGTVVVATRHDTHADYVIDALRHGKNVFVEKPLCRTHDELQGIFAALSGARAKARAAALPEPILMVGFNRRFAPQIVRIKALLDPLAAPKAFVLTVNAGAIPANHWTQDRESGGGRIIGEACHFVDLLRHLAGSPIESFQAGGMGEAGPTPRDTATVTLRFESGSIGTIHYFANGHRSLPKERLEVFCGGKALVLDNFLKLRGYGWPQFSNLNLWRQNKGQEQCVAAFVEAVTNRLAAPIPLAELLEVSRVTIDVAKVLE